MINFLKNNKYLNVIPHSTWDELGKNFLLFYLIPTLIFDYFLILIFSLKTGISTVFQFFNSLMSYDSLFVAIVACILYFAFLSAKFILAFTNLISILKNDYDINISFPKKTILFLLMVLTPGGLISAFGSIILFKKGYKLNPLPLFLLLLGLIFVFNKGVNDLLIKPLFQKRIEALTHNSIREPVDPIQSQKIGKYQSKYLGQSFETVAPLFYQSGLPKSFRTNSFTLKKEDRELVEIRPSLVNVLHHENLEGPIRLEFLPTGTKFKVVDSFEVKESSFGLGRESYKYLVLQDEKNIRSEISELAFKVDVLTSNKNFEYDRPLMPYIDEFNNFKTLELVMCDSQDVSNYGRDRVKSSPQIQIRLHRFIKDFKLENDLEILKTSTMKDRHESDKIRSCALLSFKNLQPLFLLSYYGNDWNLWSDFFREEDFYAYQNSEFKNFDYKKFIQLNENQAFDF